MNVHVKPKGLLWAKDAPIVRRVDENDVYKILMLYLIWSFYPNLRVKFAFKNRTVQVPIGQYVNIEEFQEQLNAYAAMKFTDEVVATFRSWMMFPEDFLEWLKMIDLTPAKVEKKGDELFITVEGLWSLVTLQEIPSLCIASELGGRGFAAAHGISENDLFNEGNRRLDEKIAIFKANPELRIAQFGLRRRFSGLWEEHVTQRLLDECGPVFTGVSNMYLADKFGVEAVGTNAHELPMALTALARHTSEDAMRDAPYKVLKLWQRLYSHKSLIMLDDAYGSDVFRTNLPYHYLKAFKGFRHDSGDPFAYGDAVIKLYEEKGIDPRGRLIIFSDGLTPQKTVDLLNHFRGRIMVAFGMGTNLTNDMGFIKAWSLVMKIVEAAGNPAVKLSNNLNKATGDPAEVELYKHVFGYTNTAREAVVY
jgi:nicotinate phosphoribosyltransferase